MDIPSFFCVCNVNYTIVFFDDFSLSEVLWPQTVKIIQVKYGII